MFNYLLAFVLVNEMKLVDIKVVLAVIDFQIKYKYYTSTKSRYLASTDKMVFFLLIGRGGNLLKYKIKRTRVMKFEFCYLIVMH